MFSYKYTFGIITLFNATIFVFLCAYITVINNTINSRIIKNLTFERIKTMKCSVNDSGTKFWKCIANNSAKLYIGDIFADNRVQNRTKYRFCVVFAGNRVNTHVKGIDSVRNKEISMECNLIKLNRDTIIQKVKYTLDFISCEVVKSSDTETFEYSHLMISLSSHFDSFTTIRITYPVERQVHTFGICMMVTYGTISDKHFDWLIEWFEIHRLLGVTEINVYNGTLQVGKQVRKLFEFYTKEKLLHIFHQNPPIEYNHTSEYKLAARLATFTALNHCLYSNLYRYAYTIVVDFDEVIIPHIHSNYLEMVLHLTKSYGSLSKPSMLFPSEGFYLDYPPVNLHTELILVKYQYHAPSWQDRRRFKTIHHPQNCVVLSAHRCMVDIENATKSSIAHRVSIKTAGVHHYRETCISKNNPEYWTTERCSEINKTKQMDGTTIKYEKELLARVSNVKRRLKDVQ